MKEGTGGSKGRKEEDGERNATEDGRKEIFYFLQGNNPIQ